jgi:hypothetical protein
MTKYTWQALTIGLVLLVPLPAGGQYLFLDSDGDGIHSAADALRSNGSTNIGVYLDVSRDRSGSVQSCNSHTKAAGAGSLSIFSYDLILRVAEGTGTVNWGPYIDDSGFIGLGKDDFNDTDFRTSQWLEVSELDRETPTLPEGVRKLGHISVTPISGAPSIEIAQSSSLDPAYFTGFGTKCRASAYRNTYMLGVDWSDTDGIRAASRKADSSPPSTPSIVQMTSSPTRGGIAFKLGVTKETPASLEVFDAQGRLVYRTGEVILTPTDNMLRWNGMGRQGPRAASGVYFACVRIGSDRRVQRFVLAR